MDIQHETFYDEMNLLLSWKFAIYLKDRKQVSTFLFIAPALSQDSFSFCLCSSAFSLLAIFNEWLPTSVEGEHVSLKCEKFAFLSYLNKMPLTLGLWCKSD